MKRALPITSLISILLTSPGLQAMELPKNPPRADIVEVPAIGEGLCVSNAFQTNMVLQRDKPLNLWGWAAAGEQVTVSFAGQQVSAIAAADRSWQVTLTPMPANSAPQTLIVKGKSTTLTLENILVGDIWVLGGQSNMEFRLSAVDDGELEMASANFPQIRLLTIPVGKGFDSVHSFERLYEWGSFFSKHDRKGDWDICSPESVADFSGIGYIFGRRVFMASKVPIGLIDASIGGTTVETWTPEDVLQQIDGKETRELLKDWTDRIAAYDPQADLRKRIEDYNNNEKKKPSGKPVPSDLRPGPVADMNRPGRCYAGAIKPLAGLAVKGAVWHQGFNNCFNGTAGVQMYYQVFGRMITAWRDAFKDPAMPFCILSLCTAGEPQTRENFLASMYDAGPYLREVQYKTFRDFRDAGDKNIGFASTFDLRKSWYHPQIKIPAGERAAKWALATQYKVFKGNADEFWLPPSIQEVKVVDHTLRLTMSTVVTMKDESEDKMNGFAIAGKDRRFFPAEIDWLTEVDEDNKSKQVKNILVLSSPFVPEPAHYRYAWARNPMSNITNSRQVTIAAQRSDDWLLEETPVKFPIPAGVRATDAAGYLRAPILKELELADTERRIKEAEATISSLQEKFMNEKKAWEARRPVPASGL
ncbi:MAG TPA: sialate O-acetylesterase [Verrucomicrobiales bacterium]|nr:sialate O-acetylesterase [Verrucomicrobiales bacterium]